MKNHSISSLWPSANHFHNILNTIAPCDSEPMEVDLDGPDIRVLAKLDQFVWAALRSTVSPYAVTKVAGMRGSKVHKVAKPNQEAKEAAEVASFFSGVRQADAALSPRLAYAPHLELFFKVYGEHAISSWLPESSSGVTWIAAEVFNDFCAVLRLEMLSQKKLQQPCHNWSLSGFQDLERLEKYLATRFERNRSLTVFHFRFFHSKNQVGLITSPLEDQLRDLKKLRNCRTRFLDHMRTNRALFPHKPGYVWAVEPSLNGGYGLHLTLLFNSAELTRDHANVAEHARRIGEYWVSNATRGQGYYHLCHRDPLSLRDGWVVGRVDASDFYRRTKLTDALRILALREALVRLKDRPPGKYFHVPQQRSWG